MPFLGELAALTTATCWAGGSLLFTHAARRVGAFTLNHTRITLAFVILSVLVLATRGTHWAAGVDGRHFGFLALSGLVGLTLGDWAYFRSFVDVGPRLTTLLMTLAPPFTALLAIPLLGETLGPKAVAGMAVTLGGVIWVVRERQPAAIPRGHLVRGVFLGGVGSLGQAMGLVLSKMGMGTVVDPLPATAVRMGAATVGVWILALATRRFRDLARLRREPAARWSILGATLLGPVTGVWLSLVAVRLTKAGVAATLLALTPILIIPLVIVVHRERVSVRAGLGAVIAVAGVAILFLRH